MHEYKKLDVWHCSIALVTKIYKLTKDFPKEERFGLVSQLNRAAVSIPSNIAEGCGRNTNGEFKNLLSNAYGSSCEVETQLIIANNLSYISDECLSEISKDITKIQKMLFNLKNTLR